MGKIEDKIKETFNDMTKVQQTVAVYILKHTDEVSFMTANELADNIGVSDTTVIRFCMFLGFSGYREFKKYLSDDIRSSDNTYNRLKKIINTNTDSIFKSVLIKDMKDIEQTMLNEDNVKALKNISGLLKMAETVYTFGHRGAHFPAELLSFSLHKQGKNVVLIQDIEQMSVITKKDLVIFFTFMRYNKIVIDSFNYFIDRNIPIVLITDTGILPVFQEADVVIHCNMTNNPISASIASMVSISNAIASAHAVDNKESVMNNLNEIESMMSKFELYYM